MQFLIVHIFIHLERVCLLTHYLIIPSICSLLHYIQVMMTMKRMQTLPSGDDSFNAEYLINGFMMYDVEMYDVK